MKELIRRYSRPVGILLTLGIIGVLCYYFSDIVTWIVLAWVVSLIGSPIMSFLGRPIGKFQLPASLRAVIVLLGLFGVSTAFLLLFVPVVVQQGRNLASVDYKKLSTSLEEPTTHLYDWLIERGLVDGELSTDTLHLHPVEKKELPPLTLTTQVALDSLLRANGDSISQTQIGLNIQLSLNSNGEVALAENKEITAQASDRPVEQLRRQLLESISPAQVFADLIVYTVNLFGNFMVLLTSVAFIAFFFLKDQEMFGRTLKAGISGKYGAQLDTALKQIQYLLRRYFAGVITQIVSITGYLLLCLSFFGVSNAFLIAFFAAIMNVIPYLGPFIGGVFALLVTISSNLDADFYAMTVPMLGKVVLIFMSMQLIDGFLIQPYIFSNSVSAHPLEIFIVVIVGAKLGGITGMVVAIPAYTVLRVVASVFFTEFKLVKSLTEHLTPESLTSDTEESGSE